METAENLIVETTITFNAPKEKVWQGLTDPELIKQYFFGTELKTDWKKSSPLIWKGEWEGKAYEDKGNVLDITPGEYVKYSHESGKKDDGSFEHYHTVTYQLEEYNGRTDLTIIQDGAQNEEQRDHSEKNWQQIMGGLKKLIE